MFITFASAGPLLLGAVSDSRDFLPQINNSPPPPATVLFFSPSSSQQQPIQSPQLDTSTTTMPKIHSKSKTPRHNPLHTEIAQDSDLAKFGRTSSKTATPSPSGNDGKAIKNKGKGKARRDEADVAVEGGEDDVGRGNVIDGKIGRRILDLARMQQDEEMDLIEGEGKSDDGSEDEEVIVQRKKGVRFAPAEPAEDSDDDGEEFGEDDEEEEVEYEELVSRSCQYHRLRLGSPFSNVVVTLLDLATRHQVPSGSIVGWR